MRCLTVSSFRALVLAALLGSAVGHMIMVVPPPYVGPAGQVVTLNPLEGLNTGPGGSPTNPYPCQGLSVATDYTRIAAGKTAIVQLGTTTTYAETATHGGGTCQFSISYDYPSANSTWKTIYAIIGGCPTAYNNANIQSHQQCGNSYSNDACVRQFEIPFPAELPNGRASFAWVWLNAMGNAELYMNCAPIFITGGVDVDNTTFYDALPPLFIANIPQAPCDTAGDVPGVMDLPDPGTAGVMLETPNPARFGGCASLMPSSPPNFPGLSYLSSMYPATGNPSAIDTILASGATADAAVPATTLMAPIQSNTQAPSPSSPIPTPATTNDAPSNPGTSTAVTVSAATAASVASSGDDSGIFVTIPSGDITTTSAQADTATMPPYSSEVSSPPSVATLSASTPVQPTSSPVAAPSENIPPSPVSVVPVSSPTAIASAAPPNSDGSGSASAGGSSCSPDGALICIDAEHFGICNFGTAVPQAVAAGTQCINGQITYAQGGGKGRKMVRGSRIISEEEEAAKEPQQLFNTEAGAKKGEY